MNKKVYFDEIGNAVLRDENIEKIVFNKNQVDVLKMIIEEVLANKYSSIGDTEPYDAHIDDKLTKEKEWILIKVW